ncbi:MAG: glycosyltransferase family 4 protein [Fibromonadaceae bacterium]|jgi:glycosyltransferase involved in cell wall biosynthesis|nr:glycosyltransferase family 4 protein [Fibromonadaceae bacterium]
MKTKLAIDSRMLSWTGAGAYLRNLLKFINYDIVLGDPALLPNSTVIPFTSPIYGIKEQIFFPYRALRKAKTGVLHIPHCNIPLLYCRKLVVTIHDLTHLIYPKFQPHKKYNRISRLVYLYFYFMNWFACKRASRIITVSKNTKEDIIKFFKIKPEKISVIYHGVGEEFIIREKSEAEYLYKKYLIPRDKKILLYVGNLTPHKNVEKLICSFAKIEDRDNCCLVLAGKSFDQFSGNQKAKELGIEKGVFQIGYISQEELVDFYNLADLFVFPSIYEGFGLPILEAFACGTSVACSHTSSLSEVGGEFAFYFNPLDENDMAKQIGKALNSKQEPKKLRNYALQFSWKKTAEQTLNVLNSVLV